MTKHTSLKTGYLIMTTHMKEIMELFQFGFGITSKLSKGGKC